MIDFDFKDAKFDSFRGVLENILWGTKILDLRSKDIVLNVGSTYDLVVCVDAHKYIVNLDDFYTRINGVLNKEGNFLFHYEFKDQEELNKIYHLETTNNIYLVSGFVDFNRQNQINSYVAIYSKV